MQLTITSRSNKPITTLTVDDNATVVELKKAFYKVKKVSFERQMFNIVNADGSRGDALSAENKKLTELKVADGTTLMFKDLGPQISWRGVYIIEYLGPCLTVPLLYMFRDIIYGKGQYELSTTQMLAAALFQLHFVKRELETIFIHKFSNGYMPLFNVFKNSGYYWGFAAFVMYFVMHPLFTSPAMPQVYAGAGAMLLFILLNLQTHVYLSNLRPAGSTDRILPRGGFFDLVSCPNYLFESLTWVAFTVMTQSLPALLFTLVGTGQMLVWALGKHRRYKKIFDGKDGRELYPKRRKAMFPFLM